jgi:hypothetical protein
MRMYLIVDESGRILGTVSPEILEIEREPDSEDVMKTEIVPEASTKQRVHEVELPEELEGIESPAELQEALEQYKVEAGEVRLVARFRRTE